MKPTIEDMRALLDYMERELFKETDRITIQAIRDLIGKVEEWQKICRDYTAQGYREMSGEGFEEAADMMKEIRDYGKEVNHENI